MRKLVTNAALSAVLAGGLLLAGASAAHADGSGRSGGLLGGLASTVGDVVSDTLDTTGLDSVANLGLSSSEEQTLNVSVDVLAGTAALDADASLGSEQGLLDVSADLSLLGGEVEAAVGGSVLGDSLVSVDLSAGAAGNELIDSGIDVGGDIGLPAIPVLPPAPEAPAKPKNPAPTAPAPGNSAPPAPVDTVTPVTPPAAVEPAAAPPAWSFGPGSAIPHVPTTIVRAVPAAAPAASSTASAGPVLVELPTAPALSLTTTTKNEPPRQAYAGPDTLVAASTYAGSSSTFFSTGLLAILAASAAMGAGLLFLTGHRDLFRPPASRVCLPLVPPG